MRRTLAEVLAQCRNGNVDGSGDGIARDEAVTELVRRFQPWALDLARALLNDEELGRDAVQEAFVTALQRLEDLRNPDAFPGWFRQIVRTQAIRIARKRRESPEPEAQDWAVHTDTPRRILEREEARERVRSAMRRLSSTNGRTAELFYMEEWSCQEVADLLRVPTGTVKRRLHDARKRLRSMLLGHIGEERETAQRDEQEPEERPGGRLPL